MTYAVEHLELEALGPDAVRAGERRGRGDQAIVVRRDRGIAAMREERLRRA